MFDKNSGDFDSSNETTVVTKEMFLRELLRDPNEDDDDEEDGDIGSKDVTVKRKYKKGRSGSHKPYKVLDNRDTLPFAVEVATPDPYTHPEVKKQRALTNSATQRKRHDSIESSVSSSLFVQSNTKGSKKERNGSEASSDDTKTWLGDFQLDKLTTTGDVLEIGDRQFKVVKHKCQYKYAGGKRFVMTRKILEVKEIGRLKTEEYLQAQFKAGSDSEDFIESL
ncbi:hypothetical protein FisN_1Hu140 [Fistulifera solaris]|jgi:hypothetical protein|uniref:Uncharacterized protein n=1 Tax=Fistulifera solaris TaxID=1519565 RepID=A0A1Z5JEA3_FISSO|nr:hypothetical protein FisN_1Hu140 [Fistulifera solaris]|eukprot:GAX12212.1 hypothetical protein FisN_1Hu140 [Fistulifera solaris]